jgi:uracil-DNA glycosylase
MQYGKQFWTENLGIKWASQLKHVLKTPYATKLMNFIGTEYAMNECVPAKVDIFKAFKLCPWDSVRVVILDSKPHSYCYGANGLAYGDKYTSQFSSPSIGKIHECIEREYYDGLHLDFDFSLEDWAKQGVLLLNAQLTVRKEDKGEHKKPWGKFISAVLNELNDYKPGTIYILWGKENQKLSPYLEKNNHVLTFDHPSTHCYPNNKDWHCTNFKEANKLLIEMNNEEIKW